MNRPAKVIQGEIDRAIRTARAAGGNLCVEISPDGAIGVVPILPRAKGTIVLRESDFPTFTEFVDRVCNATNEAYRRYQKSESIYIATFDRWVKIGFSMLPHERISSLQDGLPGKLSLVNIFDGDKKDELALHSLFSEYRTRGEWFENRGRLKDWVETGCPIEALLAVRPRIIL